jgi:octaprenyl-diphosphate synthase
MLSLDSIYQSIQEELTKIEENLQSVSEVAFDRLSEMLDYSLKVGGKRIRPVLTLLSGRSYDYERDSLLAMAVAVELLHTATLIHDDTIDKSSVRRGRLTVNEVWGEDKAVLLGDYLFAKAGEFCAHTGNLRVITLFSQTLAIISNGELHQAFNAFNLEQTRQQYLQRISSKTASLFVLATEAGAVLSRAPEDSVEILSDYGHNLGLAFQIVDDVLDFIGTEEDLGKPVGSDLAQGTLTLPAMLLLKRYPEDNPVQMFFQKQGDPEYNKKRAIELVRDSSVVQECYDIATEYCARACHDLNRLPDIPTRRTLAELADYIVMRNR